jgi:hypothetical protein
MKGSRKRKTPSFSFRCQVTYSILLLYKECAIVLWLIRLDSVGSAHAIVQTSSAETGFADIVPDQEWSAFQRA